MFDMEDEDDPFLLGMMSEKRGKVKEEEVEQKYKVVLSGMVKESKGLGLIL